MDGSKDGSVMIYILGYDEYYPCGGIADYCDTANTLEEAKEKIKTHDHIYDTYDFLMAREGKIYYWCEWENKNEWVELDK